LNKDKYKVRNWQAYNIGLKQRGSIKLWLSKSVINNWLEVPKQYSRGRPKYYSDDSILTCLAIRKVFHLGLRQSEGYIRSLFDLLKINLPVPDYTILCRRASKLSIKLSALLDNAGGPIDIIVDSTGLKVYGEGEWKVRKHGAGKHRTWMKLHLAIDPSNQQIKACELTTNAIDDASVVADLLSDIGHSIKSFTGDGAYDKVKVRKALPVGVKQIIPPQHNAVKSKGDKRCLRSRDQVLKAIGKLGRKQWKINVGYHKRSLAETAMFRYKTIIGADLQSRNIENQRAEARLSCSIINLMLQLSKPISIKN
jgi:Transposase DDE domain